MQFLKLAVSLLVSCVLWSGNSSAQPAPLYPYINVESVIKRQYQQKYAYISWLDRARAHTRGQFPFYQLVGAYSRGPDYDPYAQETIKKLIDLAFIVEQAEDVDEKDRSLMEFQVLLESHMGNYDVVNAAISLVRQNEELGDIEFLKWLKQGLGERALRSGKGHDIYSAYTIYTPGEEDLIIMRWQADIIDTETISDGRQFYHIHYYEDRQTGRPGKIYINFAPIMERVILNRQLEDPYYVYEPQPFE